MTHQATTYRNYHRLLSLAFVLLLWLPVLGFVFDLDPTPFSDRGLARPPVMPHSLRDLSWTHKTTVRYIKDRYGFRAWMLRLHGQIKVRLCGITSNPDVILGKEGWLFFAGERNLESIRRVDPFTQAELEEFATALESRRRWLARQQIDYVFVLMPDKSTVYREYLPDELKSLEAPSRREQLVTYLRENTSIDVVDLTNDLIRAKNLGDLYYRTDTHWNHLGGMVGSSGFIRKLTTDQVDKLQPAKVDDFEFQSEPIDGGDLARFLGLKFDMSDQDVRLKRVDNEPAALKNSIEYTDIGNQDEVVTNAAAAPIPKAIIFRDSFANAWIPYVSRYFDQAIWIWSYDFDCERIRNEHPDIVIDQWVERRLMTVSPSSIAADEPCVPFDAQTLHAKTETAAHRTTR